MGRKSKIKPKDKSSIEEQTISSEYAHIEQKVNAILDRICVYLQEDGGDVHFVRYEPEYKTVVVSLTGNCRGCPLSLMTLRGGIERFILHEIPEVKRVENE